MKKAVIYARYSSRGQTEQSIEGQLRVCHKFAQDHDFFILEEYIDRAKTAQNDQRPAFQKMLAASAQHQFEYVIVYAVDRFARDDGDYGADKKILRTNGVKLLSATETIGVNADGSENLGGILTEGILVALAKYYSRELSKKVRRGQYETVQKRRSLGGHHLFGYKVENKEISINAEQAEVVRAMFEMYAGGKTAFDICEVLSEKGITNQYGKKFVPNTIMNILKNRKFIGIFEYGGVVYDDYYPQIVERKVFDTVQEKIAENKRRPARLKAKEAYLLSGKMHCGDCKSLMTGETGTSRHGQVHHYYKCFGRKKGNGCKKRTVRKKYIEDVVINATLEHILSTDVVDSIIDQLLQIQNESRNASEITLLRKELHRVEGYITNMLNAIKQGIITESTRNELQRLENEKKEIEEKLTIAECEDCVPLTRERIELWFDQFAAFDITDEGARKYLINHFVNKVILYDDRIIIIYNHNGDNKTELSIEEIEKALGSDLGAPPQPYCKTKKDATRKTGDFLGFSRFSSVFLTFSKIEFMCK